MQEVISLKIESVLKKGLEKVAEDGRSQTYHLERALRNYLKAKKVVVNEKPKQ